MVIRAHFNDLKGEEKWIRASRIFFSRFVVSRFGCSYGSHNEIMIIENLRIECVSRAVQCDCVRGSF